jgi:hypothetical protein
VVLMMGLAAVGVGDSDVGAGLTLFSLVLLIYGIHTFGRLGPDEGAPRTPAIEERP